VRLFSRWAFLRPGFSNFKELAIFVKPFATRPALRTGKFVTIMNTTNYLITQVGFLLLTLIFIGWFLREIFTGITATVWEESKKKSIRNKILIGLALWLVVVCATSLSGFLQDFKSVPPRLLVILAPMFIAIIVLTFNKNLKEILAQIPAKNLVRIQVFRVLVEILLWLLFLENLLPIQMTFEGRNFDVVAGATAPLAAYFLSNNRKALIVWNILGLGLLFNIVTIAILSVPGALRYFMNEPVNTIVTYFPIVLLPAFLVPLAYTLHFFSLRQLLTKQ
jgi:hypothetical protein